MSSPSIHNSSDPAHPSQPNQNHTTSTGEKPTTALSAIADTSFMPTLDSAPAPRRFTSYALLLCLVAAGVFGAWMLGFELFQIHPDKSWLEVGIVLSCVVALCMGLLYWTGTANVDFHELVTGYWWLSLPMVGAAGLVLVMMQERTEGLGEVE